jgi:hypothetical protein
MSRQNPVVIEEITDVESWNTTQITPLKGIWVLTYNDELVSIKVILLHSKPKYKKAVFTSEGFARNEARKMNKLFKSTMFHYVSLLDVEDEDDDCQC